MLSKYYCLNFNASNKSDNFVLELIKAHVVRDQILCSSALGSYVKQAQNDIHKTLSFSIFGPEQKIQVNLQSEPPTQSNTSIANLLTTMFSGESTTLSPHMKSDNAENEEAVELRSLRQRDRKGKRPLKIKVIKTANNLIVKPILKSEKETLMRTRETLKSLKAEKANILESDLFFGRVLVHVIDRVLLPLE